MRGSVGRPCSRSGDAKMACSASPALSSALDRLHLQVVQNARLMGVGQVRDCQDYDQTVLRKRFGAVRRVVQLGLGCVRASTGLLLPTADLPELRHC